MNYFLPNFASPVELNKILSTWTFFFPLIDMNTRGGNVLDSLSRNLGKGKQGKMRGEVSQTMT